MNLKKSAAALLLSGSLFLTGLAAAADIDYSVYDNTPTGYGMGRDTDSANRPYGADNFNADFGGYRSDGGTGSYAIFEPGSGVVLTFDEGYENGYTPAILDVLGDKGVKAIFFVTGDYVKSNKDLIKRMIDEGHIIGNHGMKHKSLPTLSEADVVKEITTLHDLVKADFGYDMVYFRPPCGEFSERTLKQVQDLGYTTLLWSFAYVDWEADNQPDPAASLDRITSAAHEGEIMLLHAVSSVNADILPAVIDNLRAKDLEFVLPVRQYLPASPTAPTLHTEPTNPDRPRGTDTPGCEAA